MVQSKKCDCRYVNGRAPSTARVSVRYRCPVPVEADVDEQPVVEPVQFMRRIESHLYVKDICTA